MLLTERRINSINFVQGSVLIVSDHQILVPLCVYIYFPQIIVRKGIIWDYIAFTNVHDEVNEKSRTSNK